jgi:hypothetical protein
LFDYEAKGREGGWVSGEIESADFEVFGGQESGAPIDEKEIQAARDAVGRAKGGST